MKREERKKLKEEKKKEKKERKAKIHGDPIVRLY